MRAKGYAAAAVNAYHRLIRFGLHIDGIYRAGFGTRPAAYACFRVHLNAPTSSLAKRVGRACLGAGSRIAGKANSGFKAGA